MAKNGSNDNVVDIKKPATGDNSAGIKRDLLQLGREIRDLEAEKREINEQLKLKRKAVKDTGMSMAEFKYAYGLWMLEDEEAARERRERLQLALEAFGVGGQGDLFANPPTPANESANTPFA